jgi:hypothetical protein
MNPTRKPKQKPDYRLEQLDNELLLYHPEATKIFYCNETASLIWQLCTGQHTIHEITSLLSDAFPEAAGSMDDDVITTLNHFLEHGAIELI